MCLAESTYKTDVTQLLILIYMIHDDFSAIEELFPFALFREPQKGKEHI